ncbi:undecaprenyl-phosphate glucose phosphotransferase [Vibrio hippocampi]|uniref:UDP-glucose:undecaprenyl-phosphate glucose-1-phosphate transferase n=1 Tax=Vibrio hippocampi TaxID=654686 RepID=A0ABN8DFR1_9VIBR|nr:undecaprenyl-phosphate glucose phosphotransferase [Vibrio hippocampi]CAH0526168.1 UDP-glucose:undecaprenyl-phosphate glucose-1-phosphate transferase [Vibrio hippocampi]
MLYMERIRNYGEESTSAYRILDISIIFSILVIATEIYLGEMSSIYLLASLSAIALYTVFAELMGVYKAVHTSRLRDTLVHIFITWFVCTTTLLVAAFLLKSTGYYSRVVIGAWFAFTPIALVTWRWVVKKLSSFPSQDNEYKQKTVIIGVTPVGLKLAEEIRHHDHLGLELVGLYDDRTLDRLELEQEQLPAEYKGTINDAFVLAKNSSIKNVYVALPLEATKRIKEILHHFRDSAARVHIVPDFFIYDLMQARWGHLGSVPTLSVHDTPFYGFSQFLKRTQDVVLSSIIITLISPVLLAVAIGVKLSSPGPVLFKQKRYGLDGRPITVWKFRSMSTMDNGSVVKQATRNDPRITPFGSFIRRTSLDELPQFLNVLTGQMSIVGPRPHAVAHNEKYRTLIDSYMLRHHVKPGITGWAQINGYRGETDTLDKMEKRVEHDLDYIRSWSLWLDLKIIFLTTFKGFVSKTAY